MKRSKRSRIRGKRSCGYGARKKHRGKGSQGGKGMAGTGKRAGQLITWILKQKIKYFGKTGFKNTRKKKLNEINLDEINEKINNFIEKGTAKKTSQGIEINLKGYKILSRGKLNEKLFINAGSFSEKAKKKIESAGGSISLI